MNPQRTFLGVAMVLLGIAPPAAAQATSDPFKANHTTMLQAADAQLELLRSQANRSTSRATGLNQAQPAAENLDPLATIVEGRVARAHRQLLRLGVDAQRIFVEEGVPPELVVVAEVESGFDVAALSTKGARGLWQFMPETARRFGLRVDQKMDQRIQAARSTRAAARYLRELFLQFGEWDLALAAYNAGEASVNTLVERASARTFAAIKSFLPSETRQYVLLVLGRQETTPAAR